MKPPTPFRVQKFLAGLNYPACKPQVIARARARGADPLVLRLLAYLPERPYESPVALSSEVGRQAHNLQARLAPRRHSAS